jgi:hypothetical protein
MERMGEDAPVTFDYQTEKPHIYLRNLLAGLHVPLNVWWGPLSAAGIVVSGFANDLQRSLVQKAARMAGWASCTLVNKTTALAVHALRRNRPGQYLSLVLGYSAAEASVVQWEGNQLRALSYAMEPNLAGGVWDQVLLRMLAEAAAKNGKRLPVELYDLKDWLLLRRQMEVVRHRLDLHPAVTWPAPADLCDGATIEFTIDREQRDKALAQSIGLIDVLVKNCCRDAGVDPSRLLACVASGGALRQRPLRMRLMEALPGVPIRVHPPEAQVFGVCHMLAEEVTPDSPVAVVQESATPVRLPASPRSVAAPTPPEQRDTLSVIVEKVRNLAAAGRNNEAKAELARVREYIGAIELSIESPADALGKLKGPAQPAAAAEKAPPPPLAPAPVRDKEAAAKADRRKYILAKDDIRKAEAALREGRLEEAVGLSHLAIGESGDNRIFKAMIELHLRAATKRPPRLEYFEDDRRWLLCALADDPDNERVQTAVGARFSAHVSQLVELGTPEAHSAAISAIVDLKRYLASTPQLDEWLRALKESAPGAVNLPAGPH